MKKACLSQAPSYSKKGLKGNAGFRLVSLSTRYQYPTQLPDKVTILPLRGGAFGVASDE